MPYPFAHPAAVLPLIRPMGRWGAPPALVIGSMVPDAWYLVPGLIRADSHSAAGLFLFCLPAGLLAYIAYHLLRQEAFPSTPWHAVIVSLMVGALTHLAWDAVTHLYAYRGFYVLQHASTVLGTAFVVWWCCRSLWLAAMAGVLLLMLGTLAAAVSSDIAGLRAMLRSFAVVAAWILGAALVARALALKLRR